MTIFPAIEPRVNIKLLRLWNEGEREVVEYETHCGGVCNYGEADVHRLTAILGRKIDESKLNPAHPTDFDILGRLARARSVLDQIGVLRLGVAIPRSPLDRDGKLKSAVSAKEAMLANHNYRSPSRALRRLHKNDHRHYS